MFRKGLRYLIALFVFVMATATPASAQAPRVTLTADQTTLAIGQCTTVHLHIVGSWTRYQSDSLGLSSVNTFNSPDWETKKQVCPGSTTTYAATVYFSGGNTVTQLRITVSGPPPTQAPPPPPTQAPAPAPQFNFYADQTNLSSGQCTAVHSYIAGWQKVYIDGSLRFANGFGNSVAPLQDTIQVCAQWTRKIDVAFLDGSRQSKTVTINVSVPPPPPPPTSAPPPPPPPPTSAPPPVYVQPTSPPPPPQQPQQPQQPQPQPVQPQAGSMSGAAIDLDFYCTYKYGNSASAKMGARGDAWSWTCSANNQSYNIDMSDVCRIEYSNLPHAVMLNRWDAYSWVCQAAVPLAPTVTPIPFRVQVEEPLITKKMGWLSGTYQFTKADSEALAKLVATYPDAKGCLALLELALSGGVTTIEDIGPGVLVPDLKAVIDIPGNIKDCKKALADTNNILDKYIHNRFEWSNGAYVPANVEWYCQEEFNASVVVPKWDNPFGWTCRDAGGKTIEILTTQMNELCQMEYPDFPNAYLRDEEDAFSWVCRQ
jgi:hypothetical protein